MKKVPRRVRSLPCVLVLLPVECETKEEENTIERQIDFDKAASQLSNTFFF